MDNKSFGLRLSELRTNKNVSAREMSLQLGQSPGYINSIENAASLPSMSSFFAICDYLQITPEEFFSTDAHTPDKTKELLIAGEKSNLHKAIPYFEKSLTDENRTTDSLMESYVILARAYRSKNDVTKFFKYAMRAVTLDGEGCAEICLELASFYHSIKDFEEEKIWANAALSLPCVLNIETTENAKKMLAALA